MKKTPITLKILFSIIFIFIVVSCKSNPNKQIDEGTVKGNTYHSDEIGWTIEIPKGWKVIQREESQKRNSRGLKAIGEANGIDYDISDLKQLISFKKDRFHIFSSTSEKFEIEYKGEYEEHQKFMKDVLYNTYIKNGIKADTISSKEKIDNLEFDVFRITIYNPKGTAILHQYIYSKYINGFDFGVSLNYINDKEKMELMKVWKNSKFE